MLQISATKRWIREGKQVASRHFAEYGLHTWDENTPIKGVLLTHWGLLGAQQLSLNTSLVERTVFHQALSTRAEHCATKAEAETPLDSLRKSSSRHYQTAKSRISSCLAGYGRTQSSPMTVVRFISFLSRCITNSISLEGRPEPGKSSLLGPSKELAEDCYKVTLRWLQSLRGVPVVIFCAAVIDK